MNRPVRDRILVAIDSSENSLRSVRYVSKILDRNRFEVVLFHVVIRVPESFMDFERKVPAYDYRLVSVDAWEEQQKKATGEFMQKAAKALSGAGFPDDAIVQRIEERNIGIARDIAAESQKGYKALVVGRKGHSDLKDFMLGSVAQHILGLVSIPIWIVGGNRPPSKVLVCLDGSEESMGCLPHLAEVLDASRDFRITLFHAVRSFHGFRTFMREVFSSESDKAYIEQMDAELDKAAAMMAPSFDKAKAALVSHKIDPAKVDQKIARGVTNSAQAIIEEAEKGGYDTVLVGRRGLSKVDEFIMGRVSNRVVNLAKDRTVWVID